MNLGQPNRSWSKRPAGLARRSTSSSGSLARAPRLALALTLTLATCVVACGDDDVANTASAAKGKGTGGGGGAAGSEDKGSDSSTPMVRDPSMPNTAGRGGSKVPADMADMMMSSTPDTPCGKCLNDKCSLETKGCDNSKQCQQLLGCIVDCPDNDDACGDACVDKFPDGVPTLNNLVSCVQDSCSSECTSGGDAASGGSGGKSGGSAGRGGSGGAGGAGSVDDVACMDVIPSGWSSGPVWTSAEADACAAKCNDNTCVQTMCENGTDALQCVTREQIECAGAAKGPCRKEFTDYLCCLQDCGDPDTCSTGKCKPQGDAWFDCVDGSDCGQTAVDFCFSL